MGLTQPEAAAALCVSLQTIKSCETDARPIPDRMTKLATYIARVGDIGPPPYK